ncbi:unnamed protein product [Somion occarium]|uniref:NAD(+) diphosphatase n=1 Tax=Somion occarium TaxID=3059160 RepID=A0ABP1DGR3_9APHY
MASGYVAGETQHHYLQLSESLSAHTNFFAGLPLNRLAWLRTSHPFLNAIVTSSETRWVLFKNGNFLMGSDAEPSSESVKPKSLILARLTSEDVKPLLGSEPYFAQGKNAGELADSTVAALESARLHGPPIAFLGLLEPDTGDRIGNVLPSSEFSAKADPASIAARIKGSPFFALDVTKLDKAEVDQVLHACSLAKRGRSLEFIDGRAAMGHLTQVDSAIFAEARTLVDWNSRIRYCAGCGSPVYSQWAGWKRSCSSLLPWTDNTGKEPCPTATGLHNITFPRTDPVVIAVVVSPDNNKIFLGRNQRWPPKFYSALAGFVEPGESLEDAFERELWEEAAVKVWNIQFHSSQPWPFPANIMAGFYAIADPDVPIKLDLDNELEDAKWYTREEVLAALNSQENDPAFKLPPRNALAGVLIRDWAHGRVVVGGKSQSEVAHHIDEGETKPFRNFF